MTSARLGLLDGFRLEVDGTVVDPLVSAQRLLAYLALQGPTLRAVVAGTLWGDLPEPQAMASLRTAMWRVNRTVPGMVTTHRSLLALADFVRVDTGDLIQDAAAVFGIQDVVEDSSDSRRLYEMGPGELLPGWYDDWVLFERERFRQIRLHALEAAAVRLTKAGRFPLALDLAMRAVQGEPLRESGRRAVIVVHLAEHNVGEAIREYREFRRLLVEQLGIEPSRSLTALVFGGTETLPTRQTPE